MEDKNIGKIRVLVAPLDWGLGHTTRCIPVIRKLCEMGCEVWLAGERTQERVLKEEFPELPFLNLKGYNIRYAKSGAAMFWKILIQLPKLKRIIHYEYHWLKDMVNKYEFNAVISDNRYGLYHPYIPSIFITHQLKIKILIASFAERSLQKINYQYIEHFTECWIPDYQNENSLAGELSHPPKMPLLPVHYLGPLSRFKNQNAKEKKRHIVIILSGPEPQRSILEKKIIHEIAHYNGTATIVRGLPGSDSLIPSTNMLKFYNHMPATDLQKEILEAEYVISRSGYSSIMDIITLQKKCILIPTPGQPEQEYLAMHMMNKKMGLLINQKKFNLSYALQTAEKFPYLLPADYDNQLEVVISDFVKGLAKKQIKQ